VYCTKVVDYTVVAHYYTEVVHYCTMVVVHTTMWDYIVVSLETVAHYVVVVLQTTTHYYTVVVAQVVLLCVYSTPYMYLKCFLSSSPKLYSPCIHVQLTCKNYKM
jgi:hypothetical protein